VKKLSLTKETLHHLSSGEARDIAGAGPSYRLSVCCSEVGQICFTNEGPTFCEPDGCFTGLAC
jgi:hypothetical protein